MKDKNKLKKLVEIIGLILKEKDNEWLIDDLMKVISEVSSVEEIAKHSVIQHIHEYCVEEKITKQAEEFYATFPITEIKAQLIQDFIKMEHERRRDDFNGFCLSMFQQIENICNYLFDKHIKPNWTTFKKTPAISTLYNSDSKKYTKPVSSEVTVEKLVFQFQENTSSWHIGRKFRAVLYFFYYSQEVIRNDYEFNQVYSILNKVKLIRNKNHRGGMLYPTQQKMQDEINGKESQYYLKFYGFLQDFISKIEVNYSPSKKQIQRQTANHSNTIGDIFPDFDKLFNQAD